MTQSLVPQQMPTAGARRAAVAMALLRAGVQGLEARKGGETRLAHTSRAGCARSGAGRDLSDLAQASGELRMMAC